jgi:LPS O-antigen subunit length determinant protein (WzzB/FepE family)
MLNELDLTELTFIQCLLKTSMDELERNPDVYRELTGMFTLETARSVEMKIAQYIDSLESKHGYR